VKYNHFYKAGYIFIIYFTGQSVWLDFDSQTANLSQENDLPVSRKLELTDESLAPNNDDDWPCELISGNY